MKKLGFFFLLIVIPRFCNGQITEEELTGRFRNGLVTEEEITGNNEYKKVAIAKETLIKIARDYFRSDPFNGKFGQFLNHLINNPSLINKTIYKRTDTSFFYLQGDYVAYDPFFFKTKRIEVIVAESAERLIDSIARFDTVITYQLIGYSEGTLQGEADVKQEFERFNHKYKKKFPGYYHHELKNDNNIYGAINSYFIISEGLAPLSVAWQKIESANEYVFVITFRFRVIENMAILPVPTHSP